MSGWAALWEMLELQQLLALIACFVLELLEPMAALELVAASLLVASVDRFLSLSPSSRNWHSWDLLRWKHSHL